MNVKIKGRDQNKVNKAFNDCFYGDPKTCPANRTKVSDGKMHGAISMVLDGKVISAPTVNAVDLPKNPQGLRHQRGTSRTRPRVSWRSSSATAPCPSSSHRRRS